MSASPLLLCCLLFGFVGTVTSARCSYTMSFYSGQYSGLAYRRSYRYCYTGCCNGGYLCCPSTTTFNYNSQYSYRQYYEPYYYSDSDEAGRVGGIIAGIVIGSIVFIGLLITLLIIICRKTVCNQNNGNSSPPQVIFVQNPYGGTVQTNPGSMQQGQPMAVTRLGIQNPQLPIRQPPVTAPPLNQQAIPQIVQPPVYSEQTSPVYSEQTSQTTISAAAGGQHTQQEKNVANPTYDCVGEATNT